MGRISSLTSELSEDYTLKKNTLVSREQEFLTEIGDETEASAFFPQVKIKRWDNESNFSIRLQGVGSHKAGVVTTEREKVIWTGGGVRSEFWRIPAVGQGHSSFEWLIELRSNPGATALLFSIETRGLRFIKQPMFPDDPPGKEGSSVIPENVKGSYAVYHTDTAKKYSVTGGKQYKTGKAFHLYRPHITDSLGREVWGDLIIDEAAGTMEITIDLLWLNSASYPIRIDPTVGYTTIGGTLDNVDNFIEVGRFNSSSGAGDADTIHIALSGDSTGEITMAGVYASSGGSPASQALLSSAVSLTSTQTDSNEIFESGAITWNSIAGSTDYFIGGNGATGTNMYYDTSVGLSDMYFTGRTHSNDLPSTFNGAPSNVAREYSFYVTYTLSGPIITDVNTTESWTDADTGLVITGTAFVS